MAIFLLKIICFILKTSIKIKVAETKKMVKNTVRKNHLIVLKNFVDDVLAGIFFR